MFSLLKNDARGFSLVELMVTIMVSGILLVAVYNTFIHQRKALSVQEQVTEMNQNVRAAMDLIIKEVKMSGYDPNSTGFPGIIYDPNQLRIQSDLNEDGDPNDKNENIIYSFDKANLQIDRDTGGGRQPFAENIQSFDFYYYDTNNNLVTKTEDIRKIKILITGRTAKPDPDYPKNNGYRLYTLSSSVSPRNLYIDSTL